MRIKKFNNALQLIQSGELSHDYIKSQIWFFLDLTDKQRKIIYNELVSQGFKEGKDLGGKYIKIDKGIKLYK